MIKVLSIILASVSLILIIMIPLKLKDQTVIKKETLATYQNYLNAKKTAKPKTKTPVSPKQNTNESTTTVTEALNSFMEHEQNYLKVYIDQEKEHKGILGNIDQNPELKALKNEFGSGITPILQGSDIDQLIFEPYEYHEPTLSMSKITPTGKHLYDLLFTIKSEKDQLVKYVLATYDSTKNVITIQNSYTPPAKTTNLGTPTSPNFDI